MPNIRWLIALQTRIHRFIYLLTGGRLGSRIFSMRFLLLYTVGRKSGLERITPLLCVPEEGRWLAAGSNGGYRDATLRPGYERGNLTTPATRERRRAPPQTLRRRSGYR